MNKIKIAILLATHNGEKFLEKQLNSLKHFQTTADLNLINSDISKLSVFYNFYFFAEEFYAIVRTKHHFAVLSPEHTKW